MINITDFDRLAKEKDVALRALPHPAILPEPMSSRLQGPRTQSRIYAILGRRVSQKPFVSVLLGGGRWSEYAAVTRCWGEALPIQMGPSPAGLRKGLPAERDHAIADE